MSCAQDAPRLAAWECRAPSMGVILEVKVLLQADHSEQREVQLREGDQSWGGSTERIRELINKKQI